MERPIRLATIRVRDVVVMSIDCRRLDLHSAADIRRFVDDSVDAGGRTIVIEFGGDTAIDFAGARLLVSLAERLGGREFLRVCGLGPRARAFLRSVRVAEKIDLYDCWAEAIERAA